MDTLKIVVAMPVDRVVTRSLLLNEATIPKNVAAVYYKGDLRRYRQSGRVVITEVQAEVPVFSMLGKELPMDGYAEQYWQFPAGEFSDGVWYLLLMEVPIAELEISQFGVKTERGMINSEESMWGCGWTVKLNYVETKYIAEVQIGCVWGASHRFMYTGTPMHTKGQLSVVTGESRVYMHDKVALAMDESLNAQFAAGRALFELHDMLTQSAKEDDPQWVKLAKKNYQIEGRPLILPSQLRMHTSAFGG